MIIIKSIDNQTIIKFDASLLKESVKSLLGTLDTDRVIISKDIVKTCFDLIEMNNSEICESISQMEDYFGFKAEVSDEYLCEKICEIIRMRPSI